MAPRAPEWLTTRGRLERFYTIIAIFLQFLYSIFMTASTAPVILRIAC